MDENIYIQQGGAICEQCHQPLMPVDNSGAYGQVQPQSQWGQPVSQAWQQPDASGISNPPPMQNSWLPKPPPRNWNPQQPPSNSQLPPIHPQLPPRRVQIHPQSPQVPPQQAQFSPQNGMMPPPVPRMPTPQRQAPADDDVNTMDIQWGQQPANAGQWGEQAVWGEMADKPPEKNTLKEPIESINNAKTMALDLDDGPQDFQNFGQVPGRPEPILPNPGMSIPGPAIMSTINLNDNGSEKNQPQNILNSNPAQDDENVHAGSTWAIDVNELEKIYDDKVNPVAKFFKSIPVRYIVALVFVLVVAIIGFVVAIIIINKPPEVETEITKRGEIVPVGTEQVRTFDDIVEESLALSLFIPFEGEKLTQGSIVAVAPDIGVYYDGKKIADIDDVNSGDAFVSKLFDVVSADGDNIDKPIIFLFAETLPMSVVYRTVYSMALSSRKVLFGATLSNGVTALDIMPCAWPDYELFSFSDCKNANIDVQITKLDITMMRTLGEEPLAMDKNDEPQLELIDNLIDTKVNLLNIRPAIDKMRTSRNGYVRFVTNGNVTFGVFFRTVIEFYGSTSDPNTQEMYLAPLPL